MKKIFLLLINLLISFTCLLAQSYSNTTVYTPNNTPVEGKTLTSGDLSNATKAAWKSQTLAEHPNATFLADATYTYNCHGYAWHISEGQGPTVWINQYDNSSNPNVYKYFTDGSYVQVCNASDADKVHYYSGDHSAVISTVVSGKYESKWGANIRIRHDPTDVPSIYNGSFRNYYASTKITGDVSNLCSGTRTFSMKNIPGATYSWTYSSILSVIGTTNTNQITVQRNGSPIGNAWVEVSVSTPCSGTPSVRRIYFPVGAPLAINMINQGCSGVYQYWLLQANPSSYGSNWYWTVNYLGNNSQIIIYSPSSPGTTVSVKGGGTVRLNYTDVCGVSRQDGVTVYSSCYGGFRLTVSPNPAKNNINVSIITEGENIKSTTGSTSNVSWSQIESKGKTIMSLFELYTKSLVKQWKQNESMNRNYNLNINGLRKGIYVLQVDRDNQTLVTKIIID